MRRQRKQDGRSGIATIEFAMILLVLVPLLLGTAGVGINMIRTLETVQLARDVGHMYARGSDFAQPGNKTVMLSLANDLKLTTSVSTSDSVVILSKVIYIDKAMCAADGKVDASGEPLGCTNYQQWAFVQRLQVGDTTMRTSNFGSPLTSGPNPVVVDATTGKISLHDQVTNSGDVAHFSGINPYAIVDGAVSGLPSGQVIYVSEAASTGISIPPFVPN